MIQLLRLFSVLILFIGYSFSSELAEYLVVNNSSIFVEPDDIYIEYTDEPGRFFLMGIDIPEYDAAAIPREIFGGKYGDIASFNILVKDGLQPVSDTPQSFTLRNNSEILTISISYDASGNIYRLNICNALQGNVKKFIVINNSDQAVTLDKMFYDLNGNLELDPDVTNFPLPEKHITVVPIQALHLFDNLYKGKEVDVTNCQFTKPSQTQMNPVTWSSRCTTSGPRSGSRGPMAVGVEFYNSSDGPKHSGN